jgi:hypothetical protein
VVPSSLTLDVTEQIVKRLDGLIIDTDHHIGLGSALLGCSGGRRLVSRTGNEQREQCQRCKKKKRESHDRGLLCRGDCGPEENTKLADWSNPNWSWPSNNHENSKERKHEKKCMVSCFRSFVIS